MGNQNSIPENLNIDEINDQYENDLLVLECNNIKF